MMARYNYAFLLLGLLLVLLSGAVPANTFGGGGLTDVAVWLSLFAGMWTLARRRRLFVAGWVVIMVVSSLGAFSYLAATEVTRPLMLLLVLVFFAVLAWIALRDVLFGGDIDANRLLGAICVYMLLGLVWACLYYFVDFNDAGAFRGIGSGTWQTEFMELTYYSFVTLTTLGYGDIVPVSRVARLLGFLEAIAGQMYVAILVAALVGRHLAARGGGSRA